MTAYTYQDLVALAQSATRDGDDEFLAQLPQIINRANWRVSTILDLDKLDATANTTLSATVASAPAPSNAIAVRSVYRADGRSLDRRSRPALQHLQTTTTPGSPQWYCEANNTEILVAPLRPAGASAETLQVLYLPDQIAPSPTVATTWISTHLGELLVSSMYAAIEEYNKNYQAQEARLGEFQRQINDLPSDLMRLVRRDYRQLEPSASPTSTYGVGS